MQANQQPGQNIPPANDPDARAIQYLRTIGSEQICWLVESLEIAHGHDNSRRQQIPVDKDGRPLPWYTYPAIAYFSGIDWKDKDVFEFGCGTGSLFWAGRTRSIVSVESDRTWHDLISGRRLPNQQVLFVEDLDAYPAAILAQNRTYDLVIVDGKRRRECAQAALKCLAPGGMVILDNSDWFPGTAALLRGAGLVQVDFTGFGPVNNYTWSTSLFFSPGSKIKPAGETLPGPALCGIAQTGDE